MEYELTSFWRLFLAVVIVLGLGTGHAVAAKKSPKSPPPAPVEKVEFGAAKTFTVIRLKSNNCGPLCPAWIAAEGEITEQSPAKLAKLLSNPEYRKLPILLNSGGGKVYSAMTMGRMIRKYGMSTAVASSGTKSCSALSLETVNCKPKSVPIDLVHPGYAFNNQGYCNSACTSVLLSGVVRVAGPSVELGLHQPHDETQRWIDHYWDTWRMVNGKKTIISHRFVKRTYLKVQHVEGVTRDMSPRYVQYIKEMGGSLQILEEMNKVSPKDMNYVSYGSGLRSKLGLVTNNWSDLTAVVSVDLCNTAGKVASSCFPAKESDAKVVGEGCFVKSGCGGTNIKPPCYIASGCNSGPVPAKPLPTGKEAEMHFTVTRLLSQFCEPRCPEWIAAVGTITPNSPAKLERILVDPKTHDLPLLLDSKGGSDAAATAMGQMIRKYGMISVVAGTTVEACNEASECPGSVASPRMGIPFLSPSSCDDACRLLQNSTIEVRELISPDHCSTAGRYLSNCIEATKKEPQKIAAP